MNQLVLLQKVFAGYIFNTRFTCLQLFSLLSVFDFIKIKINFWIYCKYRYYKVKPSRHRETLLLRNRSRRRYDIQKQCCNVGRKRGHRLIHECRVVS